METYLIYIGKSALAAGAFYLVYLLLFQNQKQFVFNRIYLPVSLAISFIIPLITFTKTKFIEALTTSTVDNSTFLTYLPETTQEIQFTFQWFHYLIGIYLLGIAGFLFNLLLGHVKALSIIRYSRIKELFKTEVNITPKDVHPFSFFNKIVLSEKTLHNSSLEIIVNHENIHVKEKHTLDILFAEILFLFQWFNPFAWLIKDAIQNNLEYKTDHQIARIHNAKAYQLAMVELADKEGIAPFLTALNGSQLKNRIIMMKKKTENKYAFVKQLVVLPLLAILIMGLANREVRTEIVQTEEKVETILLNSKLQKENEEVLSSFKSLIINVDGKIIPSNHEALKTIDFTKGFDSGKVEEALNLNNVRANTIIVDNNKPTLYIRTSDYLPGSNKEFEKHTSRNILLDGNKLTKEYSYAIDNKIVSKKEFKEKGKAGFENVVFLSGKDASNKYSEEYPGVIADATSGVANFVLTKDKKILDNPTNKNKTVSPVDKFKVQGKVTDETGYPIPGATVLVKNKTTGTITNIDGTYEINLEHENETLLIAMQGFWETEIKVHGQNEINPLLKIDDLTKIIPGVKDPLIIIDGEIFEGEMSDINHADIKNISFGKGSGATSIYGYKAKNGAILITTKDAAAAKVRIREVKDSATIRGLNVDTDNPPLFIVDDKEVENTDHINPDNIESISVLKDKSATALYGEKGKNGVILITTKAAAGAKAIGNAQLFNKLASNRKVVRGYPTKLKTENAAANEIISDPEGTPLFIVDGKEYNGDINDIPVNDIRSIEVKKNQADDNIYDGISSPKDVIKIQTKTKYNTIEKKPLIVIDEIITGYTSMDNIDPNIIKSVNIIKGDKAIEKYGDKGKNGVVEVALKPVKIDSELRLRKFIAKEIKYPVLAQEANREKKVLLFATIDTNGKITTISDKSSKSKISLDEVVVTAYKSKELVATGYGSKEEADNAHKIEEQLLVDEVKRVINKIPKIEISDFEGETIRIKVQFVLQ